MPLMPIIVNNGWTSVRPSRLLDQHFGMELDTDDLSSPLDLQLARFPGCFPAYRRLWSLENAQKDCGSTISVDRDKFQVNLDVQQFSPEEVSVKVDGRNTITVEGKHEEKQDKHGFISRQFVRRYLLPEGHDINNIVSSLSSDGVLSITAPHLNQDSENRTIPIQQTGVPSKPVTNEKDEQNIQKK